MENRSHALAAGLFTLFLGGALLAALWWFSNGREDLRYYLLETTGNVTGLNLEAQVRYRGISAGKVSEISIDPDDPRKILIRIRMRASIPVTRGTRATLAYQGVTGLAYVLLTDKGEDPTPLEAAPGELPRIALAPGLMDQISDTTLETMRRFRTVADRIEALFDDRNLARLAATLHRLESAAAGVDRTFAAAPEALAAVRRALSPENLARLDRTMARLDEASQGAGPTVGEIRTLVVRFQSLAERLETATDVANERVIGNTVPQLNALLKDLTVTSNRLGRLIEDVDATPQMLLLGRPQSLPGPGEEGFVAPTGTTAVRATGEVR